MPRSTPRKLALVAAAVASLAVAAPASADSISFLRGGDIWLTTPDGSRQFQVTSTGDFSYASQADDGTFIARASSSEELVKLDRLGNELARFKTPVSDGPTPPGSNDYFEGPYTPEISPDGSKVAYTYYWQHYTYDPTACGGAGCMAQRLESGTAITRPDGMTPWSEFGNLTGWQEPSWADNDHIVRSNAGVALSENVVVNRVGPGLGGTELNRWLKEAYTTERRDAEVNRQKTKLALVDEVKAGDGSWTTWDGIRVYDMPNGFDEAPRGCFRWGMDNGDEHVSSPSWSPDGTRLAFTQAAKTEDLMILDVGDLSGDNCKVPENAPVKVLDGARQPDWGPADVPTERPAKPKPADPAPVQPTPPAPVDEGKPTPVPALEATIAKAKLAKVLRKGFKVSLTAPGAGKASVVAKRGSKTVAKGSKTLAKGGAVKVPVTFTAKGRKALKGSKKAALALAITFRPASGEPVTQALKVTFKR